MGDRKIPLLMDASVLIDLCRADPTLLALVSDQLGRVHVPTPVLAEEVEPNHRQDWTALGVVAFEPSLETAMQAVGRRAGLSFHDHLCLLVAHEQGWICVSNDARLRRECGAEGVEVLWGLELVALLVEAGGLSLEAAREAGGAIRNANPAFISEAIFQRFLLRIGKRPGSPRKRRPR